MPASSGSVDPGKVFESRINEDYLINQVNASIETDSHVRHKDRIREFFRLYRGEFNFIFPDEAGITDRPVVENKVKNATHDIARLAKEAKGTPVFQKRGEGDAAVKGATIRASIAHTIWNEAYGPALEMKLYMDMIAAGYMATSVFYNDDSEYPQFLRLNPMNCYPDVINEQLVSMLYVQDVKERLAAALFPGAGLSLTAKNTAEVLVIMYFDKNEVVQAVCSKSRNKAKKAYVTDRWEHKLGMVPVSFEALDTPDNTFHGLFDQLGGPLMIRNKAVRLMADYLEALAHAPLEEKGIDNADEEPSPTTVYHHDPNAVESFIRRVQPAASSGSMFGLIQYLDSQESAEAIQPPSRVGVVSQSIASGSFVASTQGTLSSVVKELQDHMAQFRVRLNTIAFKCDAQWADSEKPMWYPVGSKDTYTPSKDMGTWMRHSIAYGANAGLNRSEADIRVIQHHSSGFISKETARAQIDYIEDATNEQDKIDREAMADAFFQRLAADQATKMSILARCVMGMANGKSLMEMLTEVAPEFVTDEAMAQEQAAAANAPAQPSSDQGQTPADQQAALEAGGQQSQDFTPPTFAPPPLATVQSRNPLF
jgi:hypothetical protein